MLLQGIGAVAILSATTLFGASFIARERCRQKDLEQLERVIVLMKNQIGYLGAPLHEVFMQIAWKIEGQIGNILEAVAESMTRREGETAEEIWERIWLEKGKMTALTAVDIDEVLAFGRTFSMIESRKDTGSMELLQFYLKDSQLRIQKRLDKNGKLYYSMGAITGLLLVVVLL